MVEEIVTEISEEEKEVTMYGYKDISEILGINANKALEFLKKFGIKAGHFQIEKNAFIRILQENSGKELI